jgi:transposase InsO family protein
MNSLSGARTIMEQLPKSFEHYNKNYSHKNLKKKSPKEFRGQQLS